MQWIKLKAQFIIVKIVIVKARAMGRKRASEDTPGGKAKAKKETLVPAPKDDFSVNATHYKEVLDAWNFILKSLACYEILMDKDLFF